MLPRPLIFLAAALLAGGCASGSVATSSPVAPTSAPTPSAMPTATLVATPSPAPSRASGGTWTAAGSLGTARISHTATLLLDGRVLVAGGETGVATAQGVTTTPLASAEIYAPATKQWTSVAPMLEPRLGHTATLLADGRVLVAAGESQETPPGCEGSCEFSLATAELFDPTTNTWTATGSLHDPRNLATATRLDDGRVLVAGGFDQGGGRALQSAEIFDPVAGTWTRTGDLVEAGAASSFASTVLLRDGTVLAVGGPWRTMVASELFNPVTGTWTTVGAMPAGLSGVATRLLDGRVLVAGNPGNPPNVTSAALFDHATNAWTPTAALTTARIGQATTILRDGRVLVAGGADARMLGGLTSTELYDPLAGTWSAGASLASIQGDATTTLLTDGSVLIVGGDDAGGMSAASRLWTP